MSMYKNLVKCNFGLHWANGSGEDGNITEVCKGLELEDAMITHERFGKICVFCASVLDNLQEKHGQELLVMAKEIETY